MTETIHIGQSALQELPKLLQNRAFSKVVVLLDENTLAHCYPQLKPYLPEHEVIQVKSGEEHKTLQTCEYIWQRMTELHLDRWSVLVNLGGGVIGDMGGFCAAVFKRGVFFVQVPTTLLAQVDASVGGKTGIDFHGLKNHIGVYQEPQSVFINPAFLQTLPPSQLKSGYAEIIKHWLIADAEAFKEQRHIGLFTDDWEGLIRHSVQIKSRVVEADPLEGGYRKVLNFGHTIGHAVESYLLNKPGRELLHGEAVVLGMHCEAWISKKHELLSQLELDRIETFLVSVFEKVKLTEEDIQQIAQLALQDKKNSRSTINCTLLDGIGKAVFDQPITVQEIIESLRYYTLL
ncbi:3-dehydroquinate synthase [Pontibacter akesuensis]|uniref:3-dehydroquinate synthase n=1 Tax=Pontibacter akesuensis TaxID=388950 RepID=A0A1I7K0E5_9BACT|nr:3-dehydroquinate synthase [Pontibacter akesuensis]GHA76053.1 3-dehydroquinate synthase [Pontibacter akesuensis]SFU90904.1 3-dehydroquinate synthase [Pontibacter akesuensis]